MKYNRINIHEALNSIFKKGDTFKNFWPKYPEWRHIRIMDFSNIYPLFYRYYEEFHNLLEFKIISTNIWTKSVKTLIQGSLKEKSDKTAK